MSENSNEDFENEKLNFKLVQRRRDSHTIDNLFLVLREEILAVCETAEWYEHDGVRKGASGVPDHLFALENLLPFVDLIQKRARRLFDEYEYMDDII